MTASNDSNNSDSNNKEFDNKDFAALIADNTEIKVKEFEVRANKQADTLSKLQLKEEKSAQRLAALGAAQSSVDSLKTVTPERHAPQDPITFKQIGLQEGVYKKLRTGRYEPEAKLDLHGLTVDQSLTAILSFVSSSINAQKRCVLISHGKGIKQENPARLKNYTAAWLKQMPEVMAYHSCLPKHGGTGTVYVLLRKSEQKKLENRERFSNVQKEND